MYTKPKGKLPDFNEPVVLRRTQCSIEGFCNKLHKTMVKQVRARARARATARSGGDGGSARSQLQRVSTHAACPLPRDATS